MSVAFFAVDYTFSCGLGFVSWLTQGTFPTRSIFHSKKSTERGPWASKRASGEANGAKGAVLGAIKPAKRSWGRGRGEQKPVHGPSPKGSSRGRAGAGRGDVGQADVRWRFMAPPPSFTQHAPHRSSKAIHTPLSFPLEIHLFLQGRAPLSERWEDWGIGGGVKKWVMFANIRPHPLPQRCRRCHSQSQGLPTTRSRPTGIPPLAQRPPTMSR